MNAALPDALQQTPVQFEREAKMAMAVKLFEMKRLSSGLAAQLVGMDRVSFLLELHRYGVAMIDLDESELVLSQVRKEGYVILNGVKNLRLTRARFFVSLRMTIIKLHLLSTRGRSAECLKRRGSCDD